MKPRVLVVEDNWEASTTTIHDFGQDSDAGLAFLQKRERELFPWDGPERVCYFRANGADALRQTHGNWFHATVTYVTHTTAAR